VKKVLEINDISPLILSGINDENIKLLEKSFESLIVLRGNKITLDGKKKEIELISQIFQEMTSIAIKKDCVSINDVKTLINLSESNDKIISNIDSEGDAVMLNSHKGPILAKTPGQKKYLKAVLKNDIVFAIGPAGTGKTYQAVASAVSSLKRKEVSKIVITRPAVEAGERLGFLPGDLKEKVDPYLTPLYDALNDMIPKDKLKLYLSNKTIEIAPLAYMRGRTLHNSFMILDEAQNATQTQMKMFLTRLGVTSRAIITGDITQIDLPPSDKSGLAEATRILSKIKGIKFIKFSSKDVVRHQLVKNIINAYEESDGKK
tara:strand:- start:565 stop:1518 length:954 start_codon:yes stop_codon:yes gene_type:complete